MNMWTEGWSEGLVWVGSSHVKTASLCGCELNCSEMVTTELLMSEVSQGVTATNDKVKMCGLTCQNWSMGGKIAYFLQCFICFFRGYLSLLMDSEYASVLHDIWRVLMEGHRELQVDSQRHVFHVSPKEPASLTSYVSLYDG